MLNIHTGHDTDYLTDAVATGREGYYTGAVAAGEPAGLWYGKGAAALGLVGEVDAEMMKALYTHGLDPTDPATASRETWHEAARFGNAPKNYKKADEVYAGLLEAHPDAGPEQRAELRAQAGRSARQSVAFYDVVLSAPKSMTVAWVAYERAANDARAAGDEQAAAVWAGKAATVEEALLVGHRAVLDFLAEKAGYGRAGRHGGSGGKWLDAHGLVAAQFLQHDSRDKDPQLHVHGPILNKAECSDGVVRALDGTLITQWKDAASAIGARVAQAYAAEQLGWRWETRPDGAAREVVGVDTESMGLFSKRSKAIGPVAEALVARFREETGREPSPAERTKLNEQATLSTRRGKEFGGETREGQIARWAVEHATQLGVELGEVAIGLDAQRPGGAVAWSERDVLMRAIGVMEEARGTWDRSNLMRAIDEALPGQLGIGHAEVPRLLEGLAAKAEKLVQLVRDDPDLPDLGEDYRRADGSNVHAKPHRQRFATETQLLGEAELRAAAVRRDAPVWSDADAGEVLARFSRSGRELGVDQAAALRGILTSGASVEVLAAPAGTGKSFLVGTLAETWPLTGRGVPPGGPDGATPDPDHAGEPAGEQEGPRVFGVAYGQRQADVLAEEGVTARNIRRWLDGQARLDRGAGDAGDERFRLRSGDLLVVDEAGAADTASLVAIHRRCAEKGVKLLLVGDSKQLAAVGPGGALADIAERGVRYELAEVRRFRNDWEGPASLRLRDGDTSVVAEYAKHGRLVAGGTVEQAETAAARTWLADTIAGREALLVVGSNEAAARVSAQLRSELVRLGRVEEAGVPLGMQGTVAGVGDLIQARKNAWHLEGWQGNTEAPINRTTYRVTGVHADGAGLTVARVTGRRPDGAEQLGEPIQLPGSYVRDRVTLAYASTVHAAHGRTVDAGYSVLGPGTDPATAYTAHTRGRDTNVAFVVTRKVSTDAETGETLTFHERTAADALSDLITPRDDGHNRTALREAEQAAEQARSTSAVLDPMLSVIADVTAGRTEGWLDELAATGALPERHRVALAADTARGALDGLLRSAELAGHDPAEVLAAAVTDRSLDKSTSVAQVVHFRIRTALKDRLAPVVERFRDLLPRELPAAVRPGLEHLAAAADARAAELGAQQAAQPSQWAQETLGPVPPADDPRRAEWERRAGIAASYREFADHTDPSDPLGAAPPAGLAEKHALFRAAHTGLDLPDAGADQESMSEGLLRAQVAAWEREQTWAPRYVADELDATREALRTQQENTTLWTARAAATNDPLERDQLTAAAQTAREQAEHLADQVEQLQIADDARSMWLIETAVTRDRAESARVALGLRGLDLDHPGDRVTAQEWIDADTTAKLAADAERAITEHDLDPAVLDNADQPEDDLPADRQAVDEQAEDDQVPAAAPTTPSPATTSAPTDETTAHNEPEPVQPPAAAEQTPTVQAAEPVQDHASANEPVDRTLEDHLQDDVPVDDDPLHEEPPAPEDDLPAAPAPAEVESAPVDIRERSTPEVSERVDPAERRRVPAPDRTAADVTRARLAVEEIEQRRAAEAAADTARQAGPPDDEDGRRAELARRVDQADEQEHATQDTSGEDMTRNR